MATAQAKTSVQPFAEYFNSAGRKLTVDREKSCVHNVKLSGFESKNGRRFAPEAVTQLASMLEGARVNVNHNDADLAAPRSYRDRFGKATNVKAESDGIYGTVHFNPKHAMAEAFAWDAENSPENCGMSPVYFPTKTSRTRDGKLLIEGIRRVVSVDLVADPATTISLSESENPVSQDLSEALAESIEKVTTLTTEKATLTAQVAALAEQVEAFKTEQTKGAHKAKVETLLAEHKIPAAARNADLLELLAEATDERAEKVIKGLAESLRVGAPKSKGDGDRKADKSTTETVNDGKSFVAAITR
jgi:hypothetical protein